MNTIDLGFGDGLAGDVDGPPDTRGLTPFEAAKAAHEQARKAVHQTRLQMRKLCPHTHLLLRCGTVRCFHCGKRGKAITKLWTTRIEGRDRKC